MILDDVLRVVGDSALSDFPWGRNVVLLVNGFTPVDTNLKLDSTGIELKEAMLNVAEEHRALLLNARVFIDDNHGLSCSNDAVIGAVKAEHKVRNIIVVGFAMMLCLVAMLLTLSSSAPGQATPEDTASTVDTVLDIVVTVLTKLKE
jgi:hypothetical protein